MNFYSTRSEAYFNVWLKTILIYVWRLFESMSENYSNLRLKNILIYVWRLFKSMSKDYSNLCLKSMTIVYKKNIRVCLNVIEGAVRKNQC